MQFVSSHLASLTSKELCWKTIETIVRSPHNHILTALATIQKISVIITKDQQTLLQNEQRDAAAFLSYLSNLSVTSTTTPSPTPWVLGLLSQLDNLSIPKYIQSVGLVWIVKVVAQLTDHQNLPLFLLDHTTININTTTTTTTRQLHRGTWQGVHVPPETNIVSSPTLLWEWETKKEAGEEGKLTWLDRTVIGLLSIHFNDVHQLSNHRPTKRRDFFHGRNVFCVDASPINFFKNDGFNNNKKECLEKDQHSSSSSSLAELIVKHDPLCFVARSQPKVDPHLPLTQLQQYLHNETINRENEKRINQPNEDTFDKCFFTVLVFDRNWTNELFLSKSFNANRKEGQKDNPFHSYMTNLEKICPEMDTSVIILQLSSTCHTSRENEDDLLFHITSTIKEALLHESSQRKDWAVRIFSNVTTTSNTTSNESTSTVLLVCPHDYPTVLQSQIDFNFQTQSQKQEECPPPLHHKLFDPCPVHLAQAQATPVISLPKLLNQLEIAAITEWGEHLFASLNVVNPDVSSLSSSYEDRFQAEGYVGMEDRSAGTKAWMVAYLQTNNQFHARFPDIIERIKRNIIETDRHKWNGIISGNNGNTNNGKDTLLDVNCRVVEYHRQSAPGPGLPDARHYDMDSLVTVDIVLSVPPCSFSLTPTDFEGGAFCTLESNGNMANHMEMFGQPGDAVMFVSHKFHSVEKVTKGIRRVLVLEFWRGPKRTCDHRCESLAIQCEREKCATIHNIHDNIDNTCK